MLRFFRLFHSPTQLRTMLITRIQEYLGFRRFEFSSLRSFVRVFNYNHVSKFRRLPRSLVRVFNYSHFSKFRRLLRSFVAFRHHRTPSCFFRRPVFEYKSFGVRCFLKLSALNVLYLFFYFILFILYILMFISVYLGVARMRKCRIFSNLRFLEALMHLQAK
jgi:hypothetical protein